MTIVLLYPTDETVATAWLRSIPALAGVGVATTLPSQTSWEPRTDVFVRVRISPLTNTPHPNFPSHTPRVIVSCWAKPKKWTNANQVAMAIREATYARDSAREVTIPDVKESGTVVATYPTVRVLAAQVLGEPSRVSGESAESLARYDVPILLEWV